MVLVVRHSIGVIGHGDASSLGELVIKCTKCGTKMNSGKWHHIIGMGIIPLVE